MSQTFIINWPPITNMFFLLPEHKNKECKTTENLFMNEKIIIEMGGQIISIEFHFSFLTIYNNIVCTDGKVPAKIILLYGGISISYRMH